MIGVNEARLFTGDDTRVLLPEDLGDLPTLAEHVKDVSNTRRLFAKLVEAAQVGDVPVLARAARTTLEGIVGERRRVRPLRHSPGQIELGVGDGPAGRGGLIAAAVAVGIVPDPYSVDEQTRD